MKNKFMNTEPKDTKICFNCKKEKPKKEFGNEGILTQACDECAKKFKLC